MVDLHSAHYENFPVASLLLPRAMRPHVAAVYAFARTADDFADEGDWPPAERFRLLDRWQQRLHGLTGPPDPGEPPQAEQIFHALHATIRERSLPVELFDDLLSAFRQDITVSRYETWNELLDYCRRSANPVGRLVLRIAGYRDAALDAQADDICTALQLTNFWQDMKTDAARGRVYLPREETLAGAARRTRHFFERGRPLCDAVRGRLRHELRATWLGGVRMLDRLERAQFSPSRPRLTATDLPWFAWRLATWRRT